MSYDLIAGEGDYDNDSFRIFNNNILRTGEGFFRALKNSYTIRVGVRDTFSGGYFSGTFTINLAIDNPYNSVEENQPVGIPVINFDCPNLFICTYNLVSDRGDDSFYIDGNMLKTSRTFDFESKKDYIVCVHATQTSDNVNFTEDETCYRIRIKNVTDPGIHLSSSDIIENQSVNTSVGFLYLTDNEDPNGGIYENFTFSLVSGENDNDFFYIDGNILRTAKSFEHESKSSYNVRVSAESPYYSDLTHTDTLTINKISTDKAPWDIRLSNNIVEENQPGDTIVGYFTFADYQEPGGVTEDTYTYAYFCPEGCTDSPFYIHGNALKTTAPLDHETNDRYVIGVTPIDCVETTSSADHGVSDIDCKYGLCYKRFTIAVSDAEESLSYRLDVSMVEENQPIGTIIGFFSTTHPKKDDLNFVYSYGPRQNLWGGKYDNDFFIIEGNALKTAAVFDYEVKNSYKILPELTIHSPLWASFTLPADPLTIKVSDVNEAPTNISLDNSDVSENKPLNTFIGVFSTYPDDGDKHTYSLIPGKGDADNSSFYIDGDSLISNKVFDYEIKKSHSIRVRSDDGNSVYDKQLRITVNDEAEHGIKVSDMRVDICVDDNWPNEEDDWALMKPPVMYKAKGDLIDIVARIKNGTGRERDGITLNLGIDTDVLASPNDFLSIYRRNSHDDVDMAEIPAGDYNYNEHQRTIAIPDLTIPEQGGEFVFRLKLNDDLADGKITTEEIEAEISGGDVEATSVRLVDRYNIRIVSGAKIIITNRRSMYLEFADGASRLDSLWGTLYRVAAADQAVIYCVDKYDDDNVTTDWFEAREKLGDHIEEIDGECVYDPPEGEYGYGCKPYSNNDPDYTDYATYQEKKEEARINKAAMEIKRLLRGIIERSGGIGEGRHVGILGGDSVIPFYRVFDHSGVVLDKPSVHNATPVTRTDADNGYHFTDMFYRDFDERDWEKGKVENIFVGRVTGTTMGNMKNLLLSSCRSDSGSYHVVKLENNKRDGELADYEVKAENAGYKVITDIDGVSIDFPPNQGDDPARWSDFQKLFTGGAVYDFDMMRLMCHGTVSRVTGSEEFYSEYFNGGDLYADRADIHTHFHNFNPFFIFDSCLVGIVDGSDKTALLNSLLPLGVRGVLAASGRTYTPVISDFCDLFASELLKGAEAGRALCEADRNYKPQSEHMTHVYTRLEMNLFGLPWAEITPPIKGDDDTERGVGKSGRSRIRKSAVRSTARGTNTKTLEVDASDYEILEIEKFWTLEGVEGFQIVNIEGFEPLRENPSVPAVPYADFSFNIPLDADVDDIRVVFSNPVDLGQLNIPAFKQYLGTEPGGYVACPDDLGVYPSEQYSHWVVDSVDYRKVTVIIFPMSFDTGTKQAVLHRDIDIEVTYTSPVRGVVLNFSLRGTEPYMVNEYIETTTVIENTSAYSNKFDVTVQLETLEGVVVDSGAESRIIDSNSSEMITAGLTAPAGQDDVYRLVITVSDGTRTIGEMMDYVSVVPGRVLSFAPPTSLNNSMFVVEVENVSDSEATLFGKIYIHNRDNEEVAELPLIVETIDAGMSKTVAARWVPPDSLPSGRYTAVLDATLGSSYFTLFSDPFFVTRLRDAITALRMLAVTDGDDHACLDMNGDGKTGTEDVIFILEAVAGMRN